MKLSVLSQDFTRDKFNTYCCILVALKDKDGNIIKPSAKRFVGVARCCPEDTFNFAIGKKISLARAELKAFDYFDRKLTEMQVIADNLVNEAKQLRDKLFKQYCHNNKYIKDIVSGSNK